MVSDGGRYPNMTTTRTHTHLWYSAFILSGRGSTRNPARANVMVGAAAATPSADRACGGLGLRGRLRLWRWRWLLVASTVLSSRWWRRELAAGLGDREACRRRLPLLDLLLVFFFFFFFFEEEEEGLFSFFFVFFLMRLAWSWVAPGLRDAGWPLLLMSRACSGSLSLPLLLLLLPLSSLRWGGWWVRHEGELRWSTSVQWEPLITHQQMGAQTQEAAPPRPANPRACCQQAAAAQPTSAASVRAGGMRGAKLNVRLSSGAVPPAPAPPAVAAPPPAANSGRPLMKR